VQFMRASGVEEERIPHVLADHRDNDLPETRDRYLEFLREVGFDLAEVIWSQENWVLLYAAKR